jgi:hypothetical protein
MHPLTFLLLFVLCGLSGCDMLGIESASAVAERREADGKAVGAACRHAARAIEDCFVLNKKVDKAAIYAGWREMDDYMRENKLEPVTPEIKPPDTAAKQKQDSPDGASQADDAQATTDSSGDKSAEKPGDKPAAKGADKVADKAAGRKPTP